MTKIIALIVLTFIAFTALCLGQKTDPKDEQAYKALLDKVMSGDTTVDFKTFRIAFTRTKGYGPHGGSSDADKAGFAALNKKDYKEAAKNAESALKDDYTDMDAHVVASLAYSGLGAKDKSDLHKQIYLGLVNSIVASGDGKTANTAYVVITTHEEYVVLKALGLIPGSQALQHIGEHSYDVLTASDPKTNAW